MPAHRGPRCRGSRWLSLVVAWAACASANASEEELWRGGEAEQVCRIELVNELGGVRVEALAEGAAPRVLGLSRGVALEATRRDEQTVLTVERRDGAAEGGEVELRIPPRCETRVRTTAGPVRLELESGSPEVSVETVTGDVTARVDPRGDFTIDLATSGEITVDYSVTIEYRYHSEPAKHGRVLIGSGKTNVRLTSRRGVVSVLRRPAAPSP